MEKGGEGHFNGFMVGAKKKKNTSGRIESYNKNSKEIKVRFN